MSRYTVWDEQLGSYFLSSFGREYIQNERDAINILGLIEDKLEKAEEIKNGINSQTAART